VIKEPNLLAEAGQGLMTAVTSYAQKDMRGVMKAGMDLFHMATRDTKALEAHTRMVKTSPADVVCPPFFPLCGRL
jgi:hypothetical protein